MLPSDDLHPHFFFDDWFAVAVVGDIIGDSRDNRGIARVCIFNSKFDPSIIGFVCDNPAGIAGFIKLRLYPAAENKIILGDGMIKRRIELPAIATDVGEIIGLAGRRQSKDPVIA